MRVGWEMAVGSTAQWEQASLGSKSTALEVGLESRLRLAALAVAAGWCWMRWGRDNRKVAVATVKLGMVTVGEAVSEGRGIGSGKSVIKVVVKGVRWRRDCGIR